MWELGKIAEGNTRQSPNEVRLWFFFVSRFNHLGSMQPLPMWIATFRLNTVRLFFQAMWSSVHASSYEPLFSDWLVFKSCDWRVSEMCSFSGLQSQGYLMVTFQDRRCPCLWDFYSTVSVNVLQMESQLYCQFYLACAALGININKIYIVSKQALSAIVSIMF